MQEIDKYTGNSKPFIVTPCTLDNKLPELTLIKCCEVLIDFKTCLFPEPKHCNDVKVVSSIETKIDKVCGCKVLISGVLHKTIKYITGDIQCRTNKYVKHKDIPFSCYVDFDCASLDDTFKIAGHDVICEFSEIKRVKEGCFIRTIFMEKDIIKITAQSN